MSAIVLDSATARETAQRVLALRARMQRDGEGLEARTPGDITRWTLDLEGELERVVGIVRGEIDGDIAGALDGLIAHAWAWRDSLGKA